MLNKVKQKNGQKMIITIVNYKGGVGKSLIAHQLITCFDFQGYELDVYGNLAQRLPGNVIKIERKMPEIQGDSVIDTGGYDDKKLHEAIKISDLVLIPFIPSFESIQSTVSALITLKDHLAYKNILFVVNMAQKSNMTEKAIQAFEKILKRKPEMYNLPIMQSYQTAVNYNRAITKLAESNRVYQKAADIIKGLYERIKETAKS